VPDSQIRLRWPIALLGGACLLAGGAGATYFLMHRTSSPDTPSTSQLDLVAVSSQPMPMPQPGEPLPDVALTLTPDGITGAGITIGTVSTGAVSSRVIVSGTVEPNTSQQVAVTSPAAGRVTSVSAEPGAQVERGQALAQVSSPELAEAQTKFLLAQASAIPIQQQLERTERLMGIGAVSRQDLERARAAHAAALTDLDAARARLTLLGMSPDALTALIAKREVATAATVASPTQGTIVQRDATVGQNVDGSTRLFTIADLSSVWIAGDLPEKDLSRVRLGSPSTIAVTDLPGVTLNGIVGYIDPQVNALTHTTRVRVDAQNPRGELRLGMQAELQIGEAGSAEATLVPKEAIQNVGDRQVLYLANVGEAGRFVEHEVRLGDPVGDQVVVISGVKPGDSIVVKGSPFLRAERDRLGLRAAPR